MLKRCVWVSLCLLGCGGGDDQAETKKGPVTDPATGLTLAACGMPAYELLPSSEVGKLVSNEDTSKTWKAAELDALAKLAKVKAAPTPHGATLYRYRYTTQAKGKVVEATGMLGFPSGGAALPKELPTLLWVHGTTGWSDACSPGRNATWQGLTAFIVGQGFVVVAPDFIGMSSHGEPSTLRHPYLIGEPTALASWDAMPAAAELLAKVGGGLSLGKKLVISGASQGGHASLFTERFGAYYAPEWEVVAQAAVVPASNMLQALPHGLSQDANAQTIGIFGATLVAARAWYGAPASLKGVFTDVEPTRFASRADEIVFGESCTSDIELAVSDPAELYEPAFLEAASADLAALAPWGCYYGENSITTTSNPPKKSAPTLFVVAEKDEILPPARIQPDVEQLCAQGYAVEHLSCKGETHLNGALTSMPDVFAFLKERLAGKPIDPGKSCKLTSPVCCSGSTTCTP